MIQISEVGVSQKTDNMIKLGLVFFVCLLSFSIGTYVGKKYSDNQHKLSLLEPKGKKLATSHGGDAEKETEHSSTETAAHAETAVNHDGEQDELLAGHSKKPAALTDTEVAKLAEEFAQDEPMSDEKDVGTVDPSEKEIKTVANALKKAEKSAAVPHQTTAKEITREVASIHPKSKIGHQLQYTVQIGSFPTETEAKKLTNEMQEKGYKINFVPANINGQTWYRVQVGLFGTAREAQEYKREFLEKEKETVQAAIIQGVSQ